MLKFTRNVLITVIVSILPYQLVLWAIFGKRATFGPHYLLGITTVAVIILAYINLKRYALRNEHQGTYNAKWSQEKDLKAANILVNPRDLTTHTKSTTNKQLLPPINTTKAISKANTTITAANKQNQPMVLIGTYPNQKRKNESQLLAIKPGHASRPEPGNFITVGPPGSGKGRAITTNLYTYPESVIVLDVKGENYYQTAGHRSNFSNVFCLHPEGVGNQYDPVLHMRHSDEALRAVANIIIDPSQDREPAFAQAAENGLYAALLASRHENTPTFPYLQALLDKGVLGFIHYLNNLNNPDISSALVRFTSIDPKDITEDFITRNGLLRGAWGVLNTRCADFMTGGVMAMLSGNDFSPKDLYDPIDPVSIYLVFPESSMNATAKAFSLVVMSLMMGMIHYYDHTNNKPTRQILLLLDEAGRIKLPNLWDYLATIRGRNIVASLYVQDLSQLAVLYGRDKTDAILANCKTQIFHPATHELTQTYVSRGSGLVSLYDIYYQDSREFYFGTGSKENETHRPLITADEFRLLHPDQVVIFTANLAPILAWRLEPDVLHITPVPAPELNKIKVERLMLEGPAIHESEKQDNQANQESAPQLKARVKRKAKGPIDLEF